MLLVDLGRQLHVELLGLDDALQFLGRLAMRLDHVLAEVLDRLGLALLARDLAGGSTSYRSLMRPFSTNIRRARRAA